MQRQRRTPAPASGLGRLRCSDWERIGVDLKLGAVGGGLARWTTTAKISWEDGGVWSSSNGRSRRRNEEEEEENKEEEEGRGGGVRRQGGEREWGKNIKMGRGIKNGGDVEWSWWGLIKNDDGVWDGG
ncbi:Potassium transporter [Psidium guajava]|nr:Potassium transporter [Psidium guajava]